MAKKMTLSGYLAQRGTKAKALTRGEAALLGIPYPLQAGWPRKYGAVEINEVMLEQLAACADVARQLAEAKAKRAPTPDAAKTAAELQPAQASMATAEPKVVSGFLVRKARRYCARRSAP